MKLISEKFIIAVFCLLVSLSPKSLPAQLVAGEVPSGFSFHESDLMIELVNQSAAYDLLDLNFDGENDLKLQISKTSNGNRKASIHLEHANIGICHTLGLVNHTPAEILEEGSILECDTPKGFELHPALVGIGLGRFEDEPIDELPPKVIGEYLHYEWETETGPIEGWLKISFDLTTDTISLAVHDWIIKDELTSIQAISNGQKRPLFPNPVQDGILHIANEYEIVNYKIYNLQGQLLQQGANFENIIQVGKYQGMVVVKLEMEKGTLVEIIYIH